MTGRYLGVDLGSTTAKAVVTDAGGMILGASTVQMGAVSQRACSGRLTPRWPRRG
jgi:activator of 2-hydroxyglutaryl-CoA dehydratase